MQRVSSNGTSTQRRTFWFALVGVLLLTGLFGWPFRAVCSDDHRPTEPGPRGASQPPNIVFLLADDLGWSDTTPYGSTFYETPNIERLARQGIRFTNAYSASPLCSPTRASILTGQYPGRLRFTTPSGHVPRVVLDPKVPDRASPNYHVTVPQTRTRLPNEYVTYAEVLKQAGYRTAFLGKWHLGRAPYLPENQGFDVVVGGRHHPGPPGGYFAPWPCDTLPQAPPGSHIDDVITTEAIRFMEENRDHPFLLNLWFYSVHAPFQAKAELVEKYRRKAKALGPGRQRNPVMGAMIETLDDNVGRVLDALHRLGLEQRTLVIFTSDNGGNRYNYVEGTVVTDNWPLRSGKGSIYEGGHRVPLIISWPGTLAAGRVCDVVVSSVDYFPTLLDVVGLERPQQQVCDGVSLWPLLQALKVGQPEGALAEARKPYDARPVFCHFPHLPVATGSLPATSVRLGPWKLIRFYGDGCVENAVTVPTADQKLKQAERGDVGRAHAKARGGRRGQTTGQAAPEKTTCNRQDRLVLFNLQQDIGERKNLAAAEPERTATLNQLLEQHLADTQCLVPLPNPNYRPSALGWVGNKDAKVSRAEGVMRVESTGNDPWMATDFFSPAKGRITVRFRMRASVDARGAVYYATQKEGRFARQRMRTFHVPGDGQWHEVEVEFQTDSRLTRLRIDPANRPGVFEFSDIWLIGWSETEPGRGKNLHYWEF